MSQFNKSNGHNDIADITKINDDKFVVSLCLSKEELYDLMYAIEYSKSSSGYISRMDFSEYIFNKIKDAAKGIIEL